MLEISTAPPTPPTTATAPTIARSRVRDRGSNLRSWLKTLLLYDTTPFPFNRVYRSRAITVALPLCRFTQNQDFLIFARTAVIVNSEGSSVSAGQGLVDQGKRESVKTPLSDRNNFVRNGGRGGSGAGCPQITPGSTIADEAMQTRPPPGRSVRRGDRRLHRPMLAYVHGPPRPPVQVPPNSPICGRRGALFRGRCAAID